MRGTAQVEPFTATDVFLAFVRVVVADVLDGVSHHLLVVHIGPGRDLSTEQHHAGLTHSFCTKKKSDLWKSCSKTSISCCPQ